MLLKDCLMLLIGKRKACELQEALNDKKLIVISGVQGSGKTTLKRMLKNKGYNVVEDFEIYQLSLDKKINNTVSDEELSIF